MKSKPICLAILCVALYSSAKAQELPSPFIIKTYTAQDGLPYNYILTISQDSKGYLWVGTSFGLCIFDGVKFSRVKIKDNDSDIFIAGNEVADGRFLIRTKEGKEFLYDGKRSEEYTAPSFIVRNKGDLKNVIYHRQCRTFLDLIETPSGQFINLPDKAYFVNNKGDSIHVERAKNPGLFLRNISYANDQLYYFTNKGLYAWTPGKLRTLFETQLRDENIYSCFLDSKKRFWISTYDHGIFISKPNEENKFDYHIQLPNNLISGFFEDHEGNIWIAGFEGLIKVTDKNYESISNTSYPYLSDLNFITKDEKGVIYFFSEKNGFSTWKNGELSYNPDNLLKDHLVDIMCKDDQDRFWCITRRNQLLLFDHGKTKFIHDPLIESSKDLDWHIVYDSYRKKAWIPGEQLLIGNESGFSIFIDRQKNTIQEPGAMVKTNDGAIIVATGSGNLFKISQDDVIHKVRFPSDFYPEKIYRFFQDSSGAIWISYPGTGLLQCDIIKDSLRIIKKFTIEDGLINDLIQSVAFDKEGRLWLSTVGGLAVLDLKKETTQGVPVFLFGISKGVPATGLEYGRLLCDGNGNIWYSTQNELMRFRVSEMQFDYSSPKVNIEKVSLFNNETNWGKYTDSLQGIFRVPVDPVMKYKENSLSIAFKAASMGDVENARYSYFLYGLSASWSRSSRNNVITFTNLKPGHYTFYVRGRTNNMSWSDPAAFSFTILKPFWQQGWFRILVIMALIGIMYGIYKMRIRQIQRVLEVRKRIAGDLHDDLGSTLNSVKVYANLAALEKNNVSHLEKVKESSQEAIAGLRDIIWVLDDKKDTLDHVLNRIRQFAEPLCTAAHIQFRQEITDIPAEHKLGKEEKRNLYMILKESVNNSIKYAGCKNISLNATLKNRSMEIVIADDGIGFEVGSVNYGNGLKNIQSRAKEIGYTVSIDSVKGKGTTITLAGG